MKICPRATHNIFRLINFTESQSRPSIRLHEYEVRFFIDFGRGDLLRWHGSLRVPRIPRPPFSSAVRFSLLGVLRPRGIPVVRRSDLNDSIAFYKEGCRGEERELQAVCLGRTGSLCKCCAYGRFCSCELHLSYFPTLCDPKSRFKLMLKI